MRMGRRKLVLLPETVKQIHRMVIRTSGGTLGVLSEGKIQICLEYPFYRGYKYKRYRNIFEQAAALLYAFATFHAFIDGNKRTALIVTQLFFTVNDYTFSYPDETVDYVIAIAARKIRGNKRISKWLRKNTVKKKVYHHPRTGRKITFLGEPEFEIQDRLGDVPIRVRRVY